MKTFNLLLTAAVATAINITSPSLEGRSDASQYTCTYDGAEVGTDKVGSYGAKVCEDLVGQSAGPGEFLEQTLSFKDKSGTITVGVHYGAKEDSYLWQQDDCQAAIKQLIADCCPDGHGIQSGYEWYYDKFQTWYVGFNGVLSSDTPGMFCNGWC